MRDPGIALKALGENIAALEMMGSHLPHVVKTAQTDRKWFPRVSACFLVGVAILGRMTVGGGRQTT